MSCAGANAVSEGVAREAAVAVSVPRQSRSKDVIHAKHSLFIDSMLERVRVPVIHRDVDSGRLYIVNMSELDSSAKRRTSPARSELGSVCFSFCVIALALL